MSLAETDLRVFLSPDSDLPPDVSFLVQTEDGGERYVKAHRFPLSCVSPVFRGMFFGPIKETSEVVEVKETTAEAFETMINFIYDPLHGETAFNLSQISCPQKLFELLALATKYQIWKLATLTSDALKTLPITKENLIFTATVAKNYKAAFEGDGTPLMVRCLKFLIHTTSNNGGICSLIKRTTEHFPGANLEVLRELIDAGYASLQVPDWGELVFFDVDKHEIQPDKEASLRIISKLRPQWKVFLDFQPTSFPQDEQPHVAFAVSCRVNAGSVVVLAIACKDSKVFLVQDDLIEADILVESSSLPKIGEWTRIEISHEEAEDKFYLGLTVGGVLLGRREAHPKLQRMKSVTATFGGDQALCGFFRSLVVLEK